MTMRRYTRALLATAVVASALAACSGSSPQEEIGVVSSALTIDYNHLPNDSAITIHTAADVQSKRTAIIQYLWGSGGIPTTTVTNAGAIPAAEIDPSIINSFTNLGSSSKLVVSMELGQTSYGYLFRPAGSNGRAVIVHGGHGCGLDAPEGDFQPDGTPGLTATTKALLADGYTVVDLFMPHYAQGVDCGAGHAGELDLVPATGKPLKFFLEPVARVINYLQSATPAIQSFAMTGWSGGGWTTTVYAAIDPRVKVSIPVAGTMPIYLSPQSPFGGDFEQLLPEFYSQWGYPDLYVMGSFGTGPTDHRRQVQVLNRNDNCCFTGNTPPWVDSQWQQHVRAYEAQVQHTLTAIGAQDFFRTIRRSGRRRRSTSG